MDTPSRDGREALRKLDAENRPTYRGRQMALLRRIMRPKLNIAGSDAEYINKLLQQVVREYERISGSELDQTVKTATLMEEAPPQMQEHLRLRSEEIGTDYKKVIQAIEGHLRSKKTLNTGPDDKEVDAVVKGKSQKVKAETRARGKEKPVSQRARRIRNPTASVLFAARLGHFAKECDHRVRTVNEVNQAAPVSTPVSAVTDPHTLSHVYEHSSLSNTIGSSHSRLTSTDVLMSRQAT